MSVKFNKGWAAYERGDYTTALRFWRPLAEQLLPEQGDADAQYNLGTMYYSGRGVVQDHEEAVKWFRLAADQGLASAQRNLALMSDMKIDSRTLH